VTDLEVLRADLVRVRLGPSRSHVVSIATLVAALLATVALAADHHIGQVAPSQVNATFAQAMQNEPSLPLVKLSTARVVGVTGAAIMFSAMASDGSFCTEAVTRRGSAYSVSCRNRRPAAIPSLDNLNPFHGTAASPPPYVVAGRISKEGTTLEGRFPGGAVERIAVGPHGAFLFQPKHQDAARRGDLRLVERNARGDVTNTIRVPAQLVLTSRGSPVRSVSGYTAEPKARYAAFETWVFQGSDTPGATPTFMHSGALAIVPVRHGRFTYKPPQLHGVDSYVTLKLLDARYVSFDDPSFGMPVPDATIWNRRTAEARRVGY
jgi:hypothetical protein